jgi:multiple sugar transport system permease protein
VGWLVVVAAVFLVVLYPLYQILILSLKPFEEITGYIQEVESIRVRFAPTYGWARFFSWEQYRAVFANAAFFRAYRYTFLYVGAVTVFQFPFALCLGYVFAKSKSRVLGVLFYFFVGVMVLPFHVTLVPMFEILQWTGIFDTPWAIILPGIFSPLGVFLFRQFISQVPDEVLEAARVDGAGVLRLLWNMVLPMIPEGVGLFVLLTVSLQWGEIEPAQAFLHDADLHPMSVFLHREMERSSTGIFAPSVLYVLPMLGVYGLYNGVKTFFVRS